jgi:hypothetical protein
MGPSHAKRAAVGAVTLEAQGVAQAVPDGYFRSSTVRRLTGATVKQLDYWASVGYIDAPRPHGSGTARLWTGRAVAQVQVAVAIRNAGLDLRTVREVLDRLDLLGWPDRRLGTVWVSLPDCEVYTVVPPGVRFLETLLRICLDPERPAR